MRAAAQRWLAEQNPSPGSTAAGPYGDTAWGTTATSDGGARVHLFVFDPPAGGVLFTPRLGGEVRSVASGDEALPWRGADDGLLVAMPQAPWSGPFVVVTIAFDGSPLVFDAPSFDGPAGAYSGDASVRLDAGPGLEVRYTTDGTNPTVSSPVFASPIALGDGMEVRARSYYKGRPVSEVVGRKFERMELWPPREIGSVPGVIEEEFAGQWSKVPDFDTLTPRATRVVENFGFAKSSAAEFVGILQRGFVRVPRDGVYRFEFTCDDGGRLWIDGNLVVDNDGLHVSQMRAGTAPLAAGAHEIVVEYFNATGDSSLAVRMGTGPDAMARIPPPDLTHNAPKGEEP